MDSCYSKESAFGYWLDEDFGMGVQWMGLKKMDDSWYEMTIDGKVEAYHPIRLRVHLESGLLCLEAVNWTEGVLVDS